MGHSTNREIHFHETWQFAIWSGERAEGWENAHVTTPPSRVS
jgi:hypothetical protein